MATKSTNMAWFLPAGLLLGLIVFYPIVRTVELSFAHKNLDTGFRTEFAGTANFARVVTDARFRSSVWTTFLFTAVSVAIEFGLGLALAILASSIQTWRNAIRTILLIPWTLPTAVTAVLWAWIFNDQYGVLHGLGWLATPTTAMMAVIVADVWKTVPFVFVIMLAGLQNIPQDLYDAIEIDGGGAWAKFRYVTWPYLLPFSFVALIFRIVQAFAIFDLVWVMTGGGPGGATETVSIYTYRAAMRYLDFGYGAALAVVTVAILSVTAAVLYKLLVTRHEQTL
jgi:multiple sugar transport system permease protein